MKQCLRLLHLITIVGLPFQMVLAQADPPQARIVTLNADPGQILTLHLRPGYVSSVRVLEQVSSVALGDPGAFKAEHSEAEPQLVFFKTTSTKPAHTNALIMSRAGHEIALSLVSQGKLDPVQPVDYVLTCDHPHSFLIAATHTSFLIGETKNIDQEDPPASEPQTKPVGPEQDVLSLQRLRDPHWVGKRLRVAAGLPADNPQGMLVPFAVVNSSGEPFEVLPPQIELASSSRDKHRKVLKAEPVAIKDYRISSRRLAPGARADGVVVFERPTFKESRERLLLSVAQADAVDRPVLVPIAFVAPVAGGAK